LHAHARAARRLGQLRAPHRPRAARRRRLAGRRAPARLRLRADRVRRDGRRRPRLARARRGTDQDGALRADMTAPLDGNAIAGHLEEVLGVEMTAAAGGCGSGGATGPAAELAVYLLEPGVVARCRRCAALLIVLVTVRGVTCVDLRGLAALAPAPAGS